MPSLKNIQVEVDASYLYGVLAQHEEDPNLAKVFKEMSEIEHSHALAFMAKNGMDTSVFPKPSGRAKFLNLIGKVFGYDYILGVLLDTEKSVANAVKNARKQYNSAESLSDTAHVAILKNILQCL